MENNKISVFETHAIRKVWHDEQWYFSIVDVIEVLTNATQPRTYWAKLKKKITEESQLLPIWQQLKLKSDDRKSYKTDCANTEGILRIVMSVPSPKAEPLKLWLAQVGTERIEETENPELMTERQIAIYRAKGYPDEWIERRIQSIETRKQLTDEWQKRGVNQGQEYSILTAVISKGTFGVTPTEYKNIKRLDRQNLRDHMTPLELIFTALGEELTRSEVVRKEAQGFDENKEAAIIGGSRAGDARIAVEKTGEQVISTANYLNLQKGGQGGELPKGEQKD